MIYSPGLILGSSQTTLRLIYSNPDHYWRGEDKMIARRGSTRETTGFDGLEEKTSSLEAARFFFVSTEEDDEEEGGLYTSRSK
jgi:hypothetical protein